MGARHRCLELSRTTGIVYNKGFIIRDFSFNQISILTKNPSRTTRIIYNNGFIIKDFLFN